MNTTVELKHHEKLKNIVDRKLFALQSIWKELGIPKEEVSSRYDTACDHVGNLLQEMVDEETRLLATTKNQIREYESDVSDLTGVLGLTQKVKRRSSVAGNQESLLLRKQHLENSLAQLRKIRDKRKSKMASLIKKAKTLSIELPERHCNFLVQYREDLVPSIGDLEALKRHVHELQGEERKRKQGLGRREETFELAEEMDGDTEYDNRLDYQETEDTLFCRRRLNTNNGTTIERRLSDRREHVDLAGKLARSRRSAEVECNFDHEADEKDLKSIPISNKVKSDCTETNINKTFAAEQEYQKTQNNSQVRTPKSLKNRRRSISDTSLDQRKLKYRSLGTQRRKPLSPFRFGISRGEAAWQTASALAGTPRPQARCRPRGKRNKRTTSL